jgi:hypothetical protein
MAKKLFSIILALALVFSVSTGVFAATGPDTGTGTVTGEGDTVALDTEIYSVVLPTGNLLNFTLDPLGLLGLADGSSAGLDTLTGGQIASDTIAGVLNKSSVAIDLKIGLVITGDVTATDTASVGADTANNVAIYVRPSKTNVTDTLLPTLKKVGTAVTGATLAEGADGAFQLNKTGYELNFLLGKAKYLAKNTGGVYTYEYDTAAANGNGTAITIEGRVNSNADWSEFVDGTKSVGLAAVFSYTEADSAVNTALAGPDLKDSATSPAPILGLKAAAGSTVTVPTPTYGFVANTFTTNVSNTQFMEGGSTYAGQADFAYSTVGAGTIIGFAFDTTDLATVYFGSGGAFYDVTTTFTKEAGGLKLASSWDTTAAGAYEIYIELQNGDIWKVNLTKS